MTAKITGAYAARPLLFVRIVSTNTPARLAGLFLVSFLNACTPIFMGLPTVVDDRLERYVTAIGLEIVAVSEHRARSASYQFKLADFARRDILGLSTGNQIIFVSYELSRRAYGNNDYLWLLRHTLAHEIAHDVLGKGTESETLGWANRITSRDLGLSDHMVFRPYSRAAELAADRKGMEYWQKLGWDCRQWVSIFMKFIEQDYEGDVDHPTRERLGQAVQICSDEGM